VTRKAKAPYKKLGLKRKTIRRLSGTDLEGVVGGAQADKSATCPVVHTFTCTIIKGGAQNHNQSLVRRRGR
jgi:hypothetical protein